MKGLVVKILRGTYPSIPSCYSQNLRDLIEEMLQKDPHKRPSIKRILEKDFLSSRISQLLSQTVAKHEFGKTFLSKGLPPVEGRRSEDFKEEQSSTPPRENVKEIVEEQRPHSSYEDGKRDRRPRPGRPKVDAFEEDSKEVLNDESGYAEVVKSLRQVLEPARQDEPEDWEEPESQRVRAHFLTPEGNPLPGICEGDSAFARIEALRCYLEIQLGIERFFQAYEYLSVIYN